MFFTVSLALLLAPLVTAQSTDNNNTALGIQAIKAHFTNADLVPSLLKTFDPTALCNVSFTGTGVISPGQNLTKDQVAPTPELTITPANSTVKLDGNYTLVMADADIAGTDEGKGQTRHWLVNGVTLTGSSESWNVSTDGGVAVTEYAGPAPDAGSGPHRYVILLLVQGSDFQAPQDLSQPNAGVATFNLADYISSTHLGAVVAGMYFTVEEGTATVTPSPTSPVDTATLTAAQSTSSATGSGTPQSNNQPGAAVSAKHMSTPLAVLVASLFGFLAI